MELRKHISCTVAVIMLASIFALPAISESTAVYAASKTYTYKVKLEKNGGKLAKSKRTKKIKYKKKYGKLPKPTKSGYKFLGWYTKKIGGTKITASTKVKKKKTHKLYAHWGKEVEITLWNSVTGSGQFKKYIKGEKFGKLPTLTNSNYSFLGWIDEESKQPITNNSIVKENMELMSTWKIKPEFQQTQIKEVARLVNIERAKVGSSPLSLSTELNGYADIRAREIYVSFSHTRPDGTPFSTVGRVYGGENIACGLASMNYAENVVDAWMSSEGHRNNILSTNYRSIGVGYYFYEGAYWVQLFSTSAMN